MKSIIVGALVFVSAGALGAQQGSPASDPTDATATISESGPHMGSGGSGGTTVRRRRTTTTTDTTTSQSTSGAGAVDTSTTGTTGTTDTTGTTGTTGASTGDVSGTTSTDTASTTGNYSTSTTTTTGTTTTADSTSVTDTTGAASASVTTGTTTSTDSASASVGATGTVGMDSTTAGVSAGATVGTDTAGTGGQMSTTTTTTTTETTETTDARAQLMRTGSFYLQPYVGYINFGNWFETSGNADFTADNRAFYGVQAGYSFNPIISILGNFGYAQTQFKFQNYCQAGATTACGGGTDLNLNDIGFWVYDGDVQLRMPFVTNAVGSWLAPFVQAGVGAARFTSDNNDITSASKSYVQFNGGIGADFQINRLVGVRAMFKDYITSFKWDSAGDLSGSNISDEKNIAHNLAFTLGLNIGF